MTNSCPNDQSDIVRTLGVYLDGEFNINVAIVKPRMIWEFNL